MLVSVIIPAYNEELLIHRTLDSIRRQDYTGSVEIIVVDNKSTDDTAKIAEGWGTRVVREERKGYIYALMCGFEHACGEILVTTDADTIVPANWISTLVKAFAEDPHVVAAGGLVDFYDADWKGKFFARCILPLALAYDRLCFSYPHLWGATMAVRRDAFLKAGGWTGKFNLHADADLSRRMAQVGKVRIVKGLRVSTSARRFNHGLLMNLLVYGGNFLGLQLLRRPLFFNFPDARPAASKSKERRLFIRKRFIAPTAIILVVALWSHSSHSKAWPAIHSSSSYIKHVATQEKVIALTFDDGPNEPYTSQVLKILRDNKVRATFFLIGKNVEFFHDAAEAIVKEGHAVGNHSYSHPIFLAFEPSKFEEKQIDLDDQILDNLTGVHCKFFRPPYGLYSPWLLNAAAKRGLTPVGWSEDGNDWHNVSSAEIVEKIVKRAYPGNIILLHDGLNLGHGVDRSKTVSALPSIIANLKAQGYRFVTLPELFNIGKP